LTTIILHLRRDRLCVLESQFHHRLKKASRKLGCKFLHGPLDSLGFSKSIEDALTEFNNDSRIACILKCTSEVAVMKLLYNVLPLGVCRNDKLWRHSEVAAEIVEKLVEEIRVFLSSVDSEVEEDQTLPKVYRDANLGTLSFSLRGKIDDFLYLPCVRWYAWKYTEICSLELQLEAFKGISSPSVSDIKVEAFATVSQRLGVFGLLVRL
ncbi:hypothetical protein LINGRAHAP2_LOCUS6511, partial [Linum grandiflorum]